MYCLLRIYLSIYSYTYHPFSISDLITYVHFLKIWNYYRDLILRLDSPKHSLKFPLRDFVLHKRFLKEGKGTICLKDANVNLMIANAPPNQLLVFMKTLAGKHAVSGVNGGVVNARKRLLSTVPKSFEEISPLTFNVSTHLFSHKTLSYRWCFLSILFTTSEGKWDVKLLIFLF